LTAIEIKIPATPLQLLASESPFTAKRTACSLWSLVVPDPLQPEPADIRRNLTSNIPVVGAALRGQIESRDPSSPRTTLIVGIPGLPLFAILSRI
jgi:hypothetical protein